MAWNPPQTATRLWGKHKQVDQSFSCGTTLRKWIANFPIAISFLYGCESWTVKKAEHWRIDAFELWCWRRLLRVPWTASPQPVHSEGDQPWVFFGRNDAKAETPVLRPLHAKSWLIGKDPDAGRDWGREKGTTEDEMARWHHRLDGHEFEWTLGVGDEQGDLTCCDSWGCKELDITEWLNWTELIPFLKGKEAKLSWLSLYLYETEFTCDWKFEARLYLMGNFKFLSKI